MEPREQRLLERVLKVASIAAVMALGLLTSAALLADDWTAASGLVVLLVVFGLISWAYIRVYNLRERSQRTHSRRET